MHNFLLKSLNQGPQRAAGLEIVLVRERDDGAKCRWQASVTMGWRVEFRIPKFVEAPQ